MFKKSLTISILSLFIGIGIGVSIVSYTNAEKKSESDNTSSLEDKLPDYTGLFDNASTADNYLSNGNFYSESKSYRLTIDTSFMDLVSSAIHWYDKVISEFPNTEQANRALKDKMRTLIGWTDGYGDNERFYGLKDRKLAAAYFPMIEKTFTKLESDYPEDQYLQAFAYQIGQAYFYHLIAYRKKEYAEPCQKWMNKTIELANGKETFYSHLATHRLTHINRYK